MNERSGHLLDHYRIALEDHLSGGGEAPLARAYELGRKALADGLGILEMAQLHHSALLTVLRSFSTEGEIAQAVKAGADFLAECLSPFEMTHRGFREANAVLHRLNEMLEDQAKRTAHALHDEATQLLASVHLRLADVTRKLPPHLRKDIKEIRPLLDQIEEQLRHLSHELRPTVLDDLGLVPALEFLAEGIFNRTGLVIRVQGSMNERLPPSVETALYRVAQEVLTNAAKHARATQVLVRLWQEDFGVHCSIRDDGIGFDVSGATAQKGQRGLGLIGIQERLRALGGTLQIISAPGQGTEVLITAQLEKSGR